MAGVATRSNPYAFALSVPAAAIAAELLCPPNDYPPYPVYGLPQAGGRCPVTYQVKVRGRWRRSDGAESNDSSALALRTGPISNLYVVETPAGGQSVSLSVNYDDGFGNRVAALNVNSSPPPNDIVWLWYEFETLVRVDGQPDVCGNNPPVFLPPVPDPNPFPIVETCPAGFVCLPDYEEPFPIPAPPPWAPPIILPIVVAPVPLPVPVPVPIPFPIPIPIYVGGGGQGGALVGVINLEFNGTFTINTQPDSQFQLERFKKLLEEIKECACDSDPPAPPVQVQTIQLPVLKLDGCTSENIPLSVESGAYTTAIANRVQTTVEAAIRGCEDSDPEQGTETALGSGTAPNPSVEQFVALPPECYSVRIRITGFNDEARAISTFFAAGQRKFGSVAFSNGEGRSGASAYLYDTDTYLIAPKAPAARFVRLLLAPNTAWTVYDTGERV